MRNNRVTENNPYIGSTQKHFYFNTGYAEHYVYCTICSISESDLIRKITFQHNAEVHSI